MPSLSHSHHQRPDVINVASHPSELVVLIAPQWSLRVDHPVRTNILCHILQGVRRLLSHDLLIRLWGLASHSSGTVQVEHFTAPIRDFNISKLLTLPPFNRQLFNYCAQGRIEIDMSTPSLSVELISDVFSYL